MQDEAGQAKAGARTFTLDVAGTVLEDLKVRIRKSENGEFQWTAYAKNGRKLAWSGETYENAAHAAKMAKELFPTALVVDERGAEFVLDKK